MKKYLEEAGLTMHLNLTILLPHHPLSLLNEIMFPWPTFKKEIKQVLSRSEFWEFL